MIGAEGVVDLVVQSIATRVEDRLAILADELPALPDDVIVTPTFVSPSQLAFDDVSIEQWPFVLVVPQGDPQMSRTGVGTDGVQVFDVVYEQRIFIWVRGDTYQTTAQAQRRLTQAVKEVLLSHQQLAAGIRVDESSITSRYSDVVTDEHQATLGAAWLSLQIVAKERLAPAVPAIPSAPPVATGAPLPPGTGTH